MTNVVHTVFRQMSTLEPDVLAQVISLDQEAFGSGGMNEWFIVPCIRHGRLYVLETEMVVASAQLLRDFSEPLTVYLFGVAVKKEFRGQGLGRTLLRKVFDQLKAEGFRSVTLTVAPDNEVACHLYRRFGFQEYEFRSAEYGPNRDRLAMQLDLANLKEGFNA